ncbi:MAG: nuclease domain-containing protein [Ruminococcus flavefaciens]|nr:nuclease domain-containing protein [Ruminococcus flavefaciens]
MKLLLKSQNHGSAEIPMHEEDIMSFQEKDDLLASSIYVYNDDEYNCFSLIDSSEYISDFYINDEAVQTERTDAVKNIYEFGEDKRIFMQCFGVVQIKAVISGKVYVSDSISIMVTYNSRNKNVIKMIDYIYDKGEEYLYGDYISLDEIGENGNMSIESKFRFLDGVIEIYEQFFTYFQSSPKTKQITGETVGKFYKLDSVSPKTIQYIASHPEELYEVDFRTGITYGKRNFQPENTLISSVSYTRNVYENSVVMSFISTIISELERSREDIENTSDTEDVYRYGQYFESKKYIYRFRKKSSAEYIRKIDEYIEHFQMLWFRYRKIFNADDIYIDYLPEYTDTFRLVTPYRAVYQKIYEWFQYGGHSSAKSQLLLSFISTSKIYEYYCLIKLIVTMREEMNCTLIEEKTERFEYAETKHYSNTYCNNTFFFRSGDGSEITLYFQPVIYGKISFPRPNDIMLYRNRFASITSCKGNTYTPDYLIKVSRNGSSKYVIMDAKFSSMQTVENDRLIELVYKYLFSISTLDENDRIEGMMVLCGKDVPENKVYNLHDISESMNKCVTPFSYIVNLSGADTGDNTVIKDVLSQIMQ